MVKIALEAGGVLTEGFVVIGADVVVTGWALMVVGLVPELKAIKLKEAITIKIVKCPTLSFPI